MIYQFLIILITEKYQHSFIVDKGTHDFKESLYTLKLFLYKNFLLKVCRVWCNGNALVYVSGLIICFLGF